MPAYLKHVETLGQYRDAWTQVTDAGTAVQRIHHAPWRPTYSSGNPNLSNLN